MNINSVILWLAAFGVIIGSLDYLFDNRLSGNRFELGKEFEKGIHALGPLTLGMVGVISLAPVLGRLLRPVAFPVLHFLGADPSVLASVLAIDMGGYPLAKELALTTTSAAFSGLIVASMLGATLVFSIPIALSIIEKKDKIFFVKGLLAGFMTIPIGAFVGGLAAGFPLREVALNDLPVLIISVIIAISLGFFPRLTILFAEKIGKLIMFLIVLALAIAIIQSLTGVVVVPGTAPISEGFRIVGLIAIVLAGTFPLVKIVTIVLAKPFKRLGNFLKIEEMAVSGFLASLVNNIPTLNLMKDMGPRGKILNSAFMVSGAFVFGDHLGFVASVDKTMISYVILAKLTAALLAIPLAIIIEKYTENVSEL
ncbi:MAG: ethanolamine utilization protein EutH [bacterium]|nr:ethanolamine utilization protein EutH [bacterium]